MVRRAFFAFACTAATLVACAGTQSGTTTTTGGTVSPGTCLKANAPCLHSSDCCDEWCIDGACGRRP
jgi:hypothetical protein